ncbi:MAG: ATP-binding protein [Cyanobacteria bacterium J06576_12]
MADNGEGIPQEVQDKIFDPFFTSKPVGQGTGLGLTVCYQTIVKAHNGSIDVVSVPEEGTKFRIRLPLNRP